ncbi:extensin [Erythrobacter longus]|uniref:Extensin n=1 Tax=Erythrobacter longus TaxID=1044 RepID=A0A074MGP6_ERYLO|nr:extensin [Erythrobacter longus]
MAPAFLAVFLAASVAGCGGIIPVGGGSGEKNSSSNSAPNYDRQASRPNVAAAAQSVARRPAEASCIRSLGSSGTRFTALPDTYAGPGCHRLGTVQLMSINGDRGSFAVSNIGAVQCDVANAFSNWARFGVDRAARQILGSPLARIETMGSYACRNVAGSNKRSAHSRAEAIDVSGFVLADGRRIRLDEDWNGGSAAEREFLRVVRSSACKRFGTVLSPDYDRAHADHFHLEGSNQPFDAGSSGGVSSGTGFCR